MKGLLGSLIVFMGMVIVVGAQAQETSTAPAPRSGYSSPVRIIPSFGTASFGVTTNSTLSNLDKSNAFGVLLDFGGGALALETGILSLQTRGDASGGQVAFQVDSYGVPVLAKYSFSGNPTRGFYAKLGAMPFKPTTNGSNVDVLGVGGVGAAIPIGANSAIDLDANYNHILNQNSDLSNDYQGYTFLAGLSLGI